MSEQPWISYVGAITGVIGTITGGLALWRTGRMKSLDLRIELRRQENELRGIAGELPRLLSLSENSHKNVAAAMGRLVSGDMERWLQELEADKGKVEAMIQALPRADTDHHSLSHRKLEEKLASVHSQYLDVKAMRDKYREVLSADDRDREHIRAVVRSRNS